MPEIARTGQEVAKVLMVVGALLSGEPIDITDEPSSVEVIGLNHDDWPGSPIEVTLSTADGHRTVPLADVEIR